MGVHIEGMFPPGFIKAFQFFQLTAADSPADVGHAVVITDLIMMVTDFHTVIDQQTCSPGGLCIMSNYSASLGSGHVFGGIEAEAADVTECSGFSSFPCCSMSLSTVFDKQQLVFACDFHDCVHVASQAEKVNDEQRFGFRMFFQGFFDGAGIDQEGIRVDFGKYRGCSGVNDGIGGGDERKRCSEDGITFPDSQRPEAHFQSSGSGSGGDAVFCPEICRKFFFKFTHDTSTGDHAGVQNIQHCLFFFSTH